MDNVNVWEDAEAAMLSHIESPHNACMHKENCLSLKADLAAAQARVAELDWLLDCAKKTGITVTYRDGVMSVIHGAFHEALEAAESRLADEVEALRKDAERYAFLRKRATQNTAMDVYGPGSLWTMGVHSPDSRMSLDAAIDQAMAKGGEN